ncbi:hypothetical protein DFS34DRAFT_646235 [Phlyctochytrium arcticum]|nr:hypothetical protein DFS34DRAFT_646235 [Phlyctochytrium arcticum]
MRFTSSFYGDDETADSGKVSDTASDCRTTSTTTSTNDVEDRGPLQLLYRQQAEETAAEEAVSAVADVVCKARVSVGQSLQYLMLSVA